MEGTGGRDTSISIHVQIAAWLRILWSLLGLLMALYVLVLFRSVGTPMVRDIVRATVGAPSAPGTGAPSAAGATADKTTEPALDELTAMVRRAVTVVFTVFALLALPGIATGWGLLTRRPWARKVNIIFSVFDLISIPIGTVIGGYSLWVMLRADTVKLFERSPSPAHF